MNEISHCKNACVKQAQSIGDSEMNRTFNNGIGMVVVVDAGSSAAVTQTLRDLGETVFEIGAIAPQGTGAAVVLN